MGYYDPDDEENRERAASRLAAAHPDEVAETGDRWRSVARHKEEFHDRVKEARKERER